MLKIKGLSNDWGRFQLEDINLEIEEGEFLVVLGPSGAGKTLLLESVAGFTVPDKGEIRLDDRDITTLPPEERNMGFVYQDFALFPHLTVRENIGFGLDRDEEEKVEKLASFLDIDHLLDEEPLTLSGGEKQRVSLARALAPNPNYMLFDEPLSSLDERIQEKMRREIKKIHEERGLTSIYVTHDQTEAMVLADRIAIMMNGRVIQTGDPEEVFYRPIDKNVAKFVGVENIYQGEVIKRDDSLITVRIRDDKEIEALSDIEKGKDVRVMIRPEEILIKKKSDSSSARNLFKGKIEDIIDRGSVIRLEVDCGFQIVVFITKRSLEEMEIESNNTVFVSFKANAVHVSESPVE